MSVGLMKDYKLKLQLLSGFMTDVISNFKWEDIFCWGRKVEGVGVMKDKDIKLEDIEVFHTLGGAKELVWNKFK